MISARLCAALRRLARPGDWFAARSPRERLLAALILATASALWCLSLAGNFRTTRERLEALESARVAQDAWLTVAPALKTSLAAKEPLLQQSRKLDAEAVLGRLEKLLAKAELDAETARPATRARGLCREHLVTLRARGATLAQVVAFRRALDAAGLPMAITFLDLESSSADGTLTVRIDVTALQIP